MNLNKEDHNISPRSFLYDRRFVHIKENYKFDQEDFDDIQRLIMSDKNLLITHFHNIFVNEKNTLKEIESRQKHLESEEEKELYNIFHRIVSKHGWGAGMNIESFVEEYTLGKILQK